MGVTGVAAGNAINMGSFVPADWSCMANQVGTAVGGDKWTNLFPSKATLIEHDALMQAHHHARFVQNPPVGSQENQLVCSLKISRADGQVFSI